MDGLELSRIVKQELPDTSILILSGYGEFDYAKEAISIGVEDYLLKPVTSAQLLEAIRRITGDRTGSGALQCSYVTALFRGRDGDVL